MMLGMSKFSKMQGSDINRHVYDGFVYLRDRVSADKRRIFWRCSREKGGGGKCNGRIHTTSDGDRTLIRVVTDHNCSYTGISPRANGSSQKSEGEVKKRALGETQIENRDESLASVVSKYAASMRSVDELFELVQGNVGDAPIDFTALNELQHPIFIREMARKMEKLRLDFEHTDCSECCHCGKQIEKITTTNLAVVQLQQRNESAMNNRDWHRIVQTVNRDSECASLAIHTLLYHPTELGPTLRCLFGSEGDAHLCYPYLDFQKSSPDLFACFICRRNYSDLISYLRHAEMYHEAIWKPLRRT